MSEKQQEEVLTDLPGEIVDEKPKEEVKKVTKKRSTKASKAVTPPPEEIEDQSGEEKPVSRVVDHSDTVGDDPDLSGDSAIDEDPSMVDEESKAPENISSEEGLEEGISSEVDGILWNPKPLEICVYIYLYKESKKLHIMLLMPLGAERKEALGLREIVVRGKFSVPSRMDMERYRERAQKWVDEAGGLLVNRAAVRRLLFRYHLMSLNIPDPETGKDLVLGRDDAGRLDEDTERKINSLHSTILDLLILGFEDASGIII